ncbi:MAG TPA: protein kinase [Pirellulales bacterium]|nr:protein kinase [Pirellulales bacterium]
MPITVPKFLDAVERSGLVEKARLDEVLSLLERDAGAAGLSDTLAISSRLTQVGLLTGWQSQQLLEGRCRGFFVGKYKLLNHLGTGGMSSVYLAEHLVMRRRVAIKILPTNRVADSSYLARFHREARAVAALDHPNIVRAFDVDHEGDVHYLVMEYVEGPDLRVLVERHGPLDFRTAADYIRQAAEGLAHAHEAGLVHRDMKPANLLIDGRGVVKVLDLGLARFADEADASLTQQFDEKVLGTVDYMSPEQALDSHQIDGRADIYSLGCTLYFALAGHPPFPEGTLAQRVMLHQTSEPESLSSKRPGISPALVAICRRMMAKSPSARYQSAAEVAAALGAWLSDDAKAASSGASPRAAVEGEETLSLAPLEDAPPKGSPARLASDTAVETKRAAGATKLAGAASQPGAAINRRASPASKPVATSTTTSPWPDLLADLPPVDLAASPAPGPGALGPTLHRPGFKPAAKRFNRWESPWQAIAIGSLLGAVAAGGWLIYRAFAG